MRKEILELLLNNLGYFVSGEEIGERLNVSRTAIWKQINSLKEAGYEIEASPRQGYRLRTLSDLITAEEVLLTLKTERFGHQLQVYPVIHSTNDAAKKFTEEGAAEGAIVLAEKQSQGKGRMGRFWESPAKLGLWFSLVLKPEIQPYQATQIVFVAAVGVCRALRKATGLDVRIKWPNDLLIGGKKVCGILAEMSAELDRLNYIIVGIGLNVNQKQTDFPPELSEIATSLSIAAGKEFRRIEMLQDIIYELEQVYSRYLEEGFASILESWKNLNCTLGNKVKITDREGSFYGYAAAINPDGSLQINKEDGTSETVIAGDVSLRS